jgi:hypothetical protein
LRRIKDCPLAARQRATEVAARTVMKQHKRKGHKKGR